MIVMWTDEDRRQRPELYRTLVAQLAWHNRRLLDERLRWPRGVLAMCEHLEATHEGWSVWWRPDNTIKGWFHPAGFIASRESSGYVCGEDPAALYRAMREAPDRRHWHFHGVCCDRVPGA